MTNNKMLSVLCFASMTVACLNPLGKEALAGGFTRSCENIRLESGRFLYANCKDRNATFRGQSSLDLMDRVGNKDGHLGLYGGGYLKSCRNLRSDDRTTIWADCRTYNGDWRATSLNLDRVISNSDGNLTFDR